MEREYQSWGIDTIWEYFGNAAKEVEAALLLDPDAPLREYNPVVAMPTGTGKSHVISGLSRSMLIAYPRTRIIVLTHVKELIQQNFDKFMQAWPTAPAGIYSAGLNKKQLGASVTFAGIGSVAKNAALFGYVDVLMIDECDLVSDKEQSMYRFFISELRKVNPRLKVIGLTATPWRSGIGLITEEEAGIFTDIPVDMTGVDAFNWFVDQGYLIPLVTKPTKIELDVTGVHIRGGDYVGGELERAVNKLDITEAALREAMEVGFGRRKWLIFASGIDHAKSIAEILSAMGVEARAVHSKDTKGRDRDIDWFRNYQGEAPIALVNMGILTTGFDDPTIDLIVMLRPTQSARLWVQMLGRGTRPWYMPGYDLSTQEGRLLAILNSPKHNCMVLDYAANIRKLGPINDPVIPRKKGKGGPQPAPVKRCEHCTTYNHTTARFCGGKSKTDPAFNPAAGCGEEFVFQINLKVEASSQEIIKKADLPIVKTFDVDHITYALHTKVGAKPMMKVTYFCGMARFTDYVCIEHEKGSFPRKKAMDWWRERSTETMPVPVAVDVALEYSSMLKAPTHLDVHINVKYPVIMRYCFDGSRFGAIQVTDPSALRMPTVTTEAKRFSNDDDIPLDSMKLSPARFDEMDSDIPF